MSRYYDKDGSPLTLHEWSSKYTNEYKRVAQTNVAGKYNVSTIWLGLDHRYGEGAPLIFETMVFPIDSFSDLDCDRYSTLAQAEAGHAAMVEKWSKPEVPT